MTLTIKVTDSTGNVATATKNLIVDAPVQNRKIIGMSAPSSEWSERVSEVGSYGLKARRIFISSLNSSGSLPSTVAQAVSDGMMPILSFKVGTPTNVPSGAYDSWVENLVDNISAFNVPFSLTYHHEPNPDMTGSVFRAANKRFAPIIQANPLIKFGPLLNGWLLDNQVSTWAGYLDAELLDTWDFVGMDTYEAGTLTNPGSIKPQHRIPKLVNWLTQQGHPDMPITIGEYNGWSATTIRDCGEAILSTPTMWYASLFNSINGEKGRVLTGADIDAFKATKADPRALQ